ncbi:hypothetical protein WBP06_03140 [Novosphingobium sp. BL-8H]|uniref:hypothetical protein n=1 Tax=Novosphingobium sp. BL-8H TaxID=3127640 RepID=UPI003756A891
MAAKLRVFRTAVGFHDAYVAAPSQKAALTAWGADSNLFASGFAERVDDPALTKAPLESPGMVIKVPRGTTAEHLSSLADAPRKPSSRHSAPAAGDKPAPQRRPKPAPPPEPKRPPPRPSRTKLEEADEALARHDRDIEVEMAALEAEQTRISEKISARRAAAGRRRAKLASRRDQACKAYEAAMARWREAI